MTTTEPSDYPDTEEGARRVLRYWADLDVNDKVRDEVEAGKLEWIPDPVVPGVWGVARKGTDQVVVIVYTGDQPDFEVDDEWLYDYE